MFNDESGDALYSGFLPFGLTCGQWLAFGRSRIAESATSDNSGISDS